MLTLPLTISPSGTAITRKEKHMFDSFRRLPGKDRLEFGLTITMITVGLLAIGAILFA